MSGEMQDLERYGQGLFARVPLDERAGFRHDLRARLLAQVGSAAQARRTAPWWTLRIPRFAMAAAAAVALLLGGGGLAAAGSLPGEPLFVLKRAAEEVVLTFAPDEAARAERLADQASVRLAELRRAGGEQQAAAAIEYAQTIVRLARSVGELGPAPELRPPSRADVELERAPEVLRELETTVPAPAQEGIRRAIEASERTGRGTDKERGTEGNEGAPVERPGPAEPPGRPESPGPPSSPGRGDR